MKSHEQFQAVSRWMVSAVLLVFVAGVIVSGCALVKPHRQLDETTPVDSGLRGASLENLTVMPFRCDDATWGDYAAQRMREYLLEEQAFTGVVLGGTEEAANRYVMHGHLEHLFFGGSDLPTAVALSVSIVDTLDGQTRFFRKTRASSKKSAFHMTWFSRVFVPSPYPEEVLNSLLRKIAIDVALRTRLPKVE